MALYIPHSIFPFCAAFVCQAGNFWVHYMCTYYEGTHAIFCHILPLPRSQLEIFASELVSQTLSSYRVPLLLGTKFKNSHWAQF